MSWFRQIKILYSISLNMFLYIVYGIISSTVFSNKVSYRLFFTALGTTLLLQFLNTKFRKKTVIIFPIILGIIIIFHTGRGNGILYSCLYIIFINHISYTYEREEINYDIYRERGEHALIFILIAGLFIPFIDGSLAKELIKFYVMFVVLLIWTLREVRGYSYKLKSKNALIANISLAGSVVLLSIDKVFYSAVNAFSMIFRAVNHGLGYIADLILKAFIFLLQKPAQYIMSMIKPLTGKPSPLEEEGGSINTPEPIFVRGTTERELPLWVNSAVKIIILISVMYIIYRIALKNRYFDHESSKNDLQERREKIKKTEPKKKGFFDRKLKNLFMPKNLKDQVLEIYRRFEVKTASKGIFKAHMTAKQLENVTKAYVKNAENLNSLTDIYNEAKFSDHDVTEEKAKTIKDNFNKIKNQI